MNINNSLLILRYLMFGFVFCSANAVAEMYKSIDDEGNVSYTDRPPYQGAKPLDAPSISSISPPKSKKKFKEPPKTQGGKANKPTKYTKLLIKSPVNEATIRNNSGNFSISIGIKPALNVKQGDYLSVSIDGVALPKKLQTTSINLQGIDRGTHVIKAVVKNKKGKVLRQSKPVTVFLHRFSRLNRPKI